MKAGSALNASVIVDRPHADLLPSRLTILDEPLPFIRLQTRIRHHKVRARLPAQLSGQLRYATQVRELSVWHDDRCRP